MTPERKKALLVVLLFCLIPVMNALDVWHKRLTYDEGSHLKYGQNILDGDARRTGNMNSKMPCTALNALPGAAWNRVEAGGLADTLAPLRALGNPGAGRLMTVLFSMLVGWFVYRWARELYGFAAGVGALLFYTFSPNILAHSRLITTDVYGAGTVLIALYFFWRFLNGSSRRRAFAAAFAMGLAQLGKYSCIGLYPACLGVVVIAFAPATVRELAGKRFGALGRRLFRFLGWVVVFAVVSIAVINVGFLFDRTFTPLGDYAFHSGKFRSFQGISPLLDRMPVPVPYPYIEGLDLCWHYGDSPMKTYLAGELRTATGFVGYYLRAFFYKEPLVLQLLLLLALVALVVRRRIAFLTNELVVLFPLAFYVTYFNFFMNLNVGLRHFLVTLPLMYVLTSGLLASWTSFGPIRKGAAAAAVGWLVVSVLSYAPHYLSYFNETVWDRKMAYEVLADSNIDWGQNGWYLDEYRRVNPEVVKAPPRPVAGRLVVPVNHVTGVTAPHEQYRWLRDYFVPVDHVAYSYLVYDVEPARLKDVIRDLKRRLRSVNVVYDPKTVLRHVTEADLASLAEWRKHEGEWFAFHSVSKAPPDAHWFAEYMQDPDRLMFIVRVDDEDLGCMGVRIVDRRAIIDNVMLCKRPRHFHNHDSLAPRMLGSALLVLGLDRVEVRVPDGDQKVLDWYVLNRFEKTGESGGTVRFGAPTEAFLDPLLSVQFAPKVK